MRIIREVIDLVRLSYSEIVKELADFLDVEAMSEDEDEGYWYMRGAVEFAQHLKAAASEPVLPAPKL